MPHKLLLADDSVTIQRVIELTFADEDIQVIAVGDGKQAIDRVQQERPDIVLADVGMPERDGYEVASFIKGNPQLAHIPVLLLTGAFEPIDETRARSVGCDGVLVKPFEPQMVINRVRDLLAGRRPAGLWTANPAAQAPLRAPAPAATDLDLRRPAAASASSGGGGEAIESYFDRLDAAFSGRTDSPAPGPGQPAPEPTTVPASAAPMQQQEYGYHEPAPVAPAAAPGPPPVSVSEWDPELAGAPSSAPSHTAAPTSVGRTPDPLSSWNPDLTSAPQPSMSTAPATAPTAASAAPPGPAPLPPMPPLADAFAALLAAERGQPVVPSAHRAAAISDEQIDEIVTRVIERMGDQSTRRTVLEAAERLVREEIQRIKGR
jgi:CheY-like chemotaxis protein